MALPGSPEPGWLKCRSIRRVKPLRRNVVVRSVGRSVASGPVNGDGRMIFRYCPQIRQDYPPNLSILLSGGKETNQDSPSNGERTGKSPTWKSGGRAVRIVV